MKKLPKKLKISLEKILELRYGENWHQKKATLYRVPGLSREINQLHGKKLSFNNIADVAAAEELVLRFKEPAAVVVKHTNPCGCAVGGSILQAYLGAQEGDPLSAFGGIVALNREMDSKVAAQIVSDTDTSGNPNFKEVVIAPGYAENALKVLKTKKNIRILDSSMQANKAHRFAAFDIKKVGGYFLVQETDTREIRERDLKLATGTRKPTKAEVEDMLFAWKVVKSVKSNAIVLAKAGQLVGMGAGQPSRIDSADMAVKKAAGRQKGAVLASDAFFPFPDCVELAGGVGISAIIQPGGSKNDQASIDAANRLGIPMVFTGVRAFRH